MPPGGMGGGYATEGEWGHCDTTGGRGDDSDLEGSCARQLVCDPPVGTTGAGNGCANQFLPFGAGGGTYGDAELTVCATCCQP